MEAGGGGGLDAVIGLGEGAGFDEGGCIDGGSSRDIAAFPAGRLG